MLIFLNRETTVMSTYNNSTTPALFQGSELINAMHNACIMPICSYANDSDSPSGREGHISPNPNLNIYYTLRYIVFITY